jgi:hypothetical protein
MRAAWLLGALACSSGKTADFPTGTLEVEWVGTDTGKLAAPAVAEWCDGLKLLELRAIHGDTGIALALYPSRAGAGADSIATGDYPVVSPERADSSRPSAAVALRWFEETSIRGFRGDSGKIALETSGPGTSAGRFSAHLRSSEGSRIAVTGLFKGLTVTPAPGNCVGGPAEEAGEADDIDVTDVPQETAD